MTTATPSAVQPGNRSITGYLIRGLLYKLFLLVFFLIAAGRIDWWPAWIYCAIFFAFDLATAALVDPALLTERSTRHADMKAWDKSLMALAGGFLPLLAGIVAGLDTRFGWGPVVSLSAQVIAGMVCVLGYGIIVWSMWANAYFSAVVRIQKERGHQVATGGPYRIVRHPGYVGAMLFTLAMPVLMGSLWGLIPSAIAVLLYVMRTSLEDATLQEELPGYRAFAQQTRYRLLPGVW
jgi:protein-S-isoprenylcysteine O-methyltransferase Ste14